jgi:hypothetical protein
MFSASSGSVLSDLCGFKIPPFLRVVAIKISGFSIDNQKSKINNPFDSQPLHSYHVEIP